MFAQFFKQATAAKRKRIKEKELERISEADKEFTEEERKKKLSNKTEEEDGDEKEVAAEKPRKKRSRTEKEDETEDRKKPVKKEKKQKREEPKEDEEHDDEDGGKKKKRHHVVQMSSEEVAEAWQRLMNGEKLSDEEDEDEDLDDQEEVAPAFSQEECKIFVGGIRDSEEKIKARFSKWGTVLYAATDITIPDAHSQQGCLLTIFTPVCCC